MKPLLDVRPDHLEIIQKILRRHVPGREIWAFGSRATWTAKEHSDLDLAVIGEEPLSFQTLGALRDDFSESDLPYKVDVVDWATTSESFREIIRKDKVVVQTTQGLNPASLSKWTKIPLGDLVRNLDSRRVPLSSREREIKRGTYPYYGATGIMDYVDDFLFEGLHLLIAEDGSVETKDGKPFLQLVDGKFWVNNHAHVLKGKTDEDTKFLYYALSTVAIRPFISGSVQGKLSQKNLNQIPIFYPINDDMRHVIVSILGALDDKIELNRKINETLEAAARAIFKDWFVDFSPVRAKAAGKKPYGMDDATAALFPDSFEDSELGEIPRGWRVGALESVLGELEVGGRPKGGVSAYTEGVPSIGAESIAGLGIFDFSKTKYVPREFFEAMAKGHIQNRDVLLYKDGGRPGEFEPHATLFGENFPYATCAINEHVYRIRAKPEIGQNFLFFWLSSDFLMEEMRVKGTGVAIPGLNSTQVKSLTTLVPSPEISKAFNSLVDPYVTRVLSNCNESRTLAVLRDALLPGLMSGEVRVREVEKITGAAI
ncbi:MAG: restriction endonuclease subunit S [Bdellovibrionota bacterium]